MNKHTSNPEPISKSWDVYWKGAAGAAAYSASGINHPALQSFWDVFLRQSQTVNSRPRCIDIASGNGAVVDILQKVFGPDGCDITCIDVSSGAIATLQKRFPTANCIVADAAALSLDSASFDIVTSQFGVEYAGETAFSEAARLVAPGGALALAMHYSGGNIHRECAASLDAIRRTQQANFIPLALRFFEAGFAACRGGDRLPYDTAGAALDPAVRELESIMQQHGAHVAGDTIGRLYDDVATIHSSIQQYDPPDVLEWLRKMEHELEAFAGRMSSMCDSALDADSFDRVVDRIASVGLNVRDRGPLVDGPQGSPLAWTLTANA
jgi:SAM-dependent methyltransferase